MKHSYPPQGEDEGLVFTPYITINGKKKYHPKYFSEGKVYRFKPKQKKKNSDDLIR